MVRHYTLSPEDLALINRRRGDPNRLGFAAHALLPAISQGGYFNKVNNRPLRYAPSSPSNWASMRRTSAIMPNVTKLAGSTSLRLRLLLGFAH